MIDPFLKQIIDDAIAQADASARACDALITRSSSKMNLVYRVNENAKVQTEDAVLNQVQNSGLSEDEIVAGVGEALAVMRDKAFDYADAVEGRLHAELVALRDEVKALRAQVEANNVTPIPRPKNVA